MPDSFIPLAHAKGYTEAERGLVLSAFFWGYLWFQLPGGLFADRFGGKRVLGAGVALWSIATFLTPTTGSLKWSRIASPWRSSTGQPSS